MTGFEKTLTISDVAQILQVSEKTISRMLADGGIPGFKVANQWRFLAEDIEQWLREKRNRRDLTARSGIATMVSQELEVLPLSRMVSPDLIVINLRAGKPRTMLTDLIQPLVNDNLIRNPQKFVDGLIAREQMMSTGVGGGVALPHLRNPADQRVIRPLIVIGTCPQGADWNAIDGKPVNLFLLPVTGDEVVHLRTLGAIRRGLSVEGTISRIVDAGSPDEVMSILIRNESIMWNG